MQGAPPPMAMVCEFVCVHSDNSPIQRTAQSHSNSIICLSQNNIIAQKTTQLICGGELGNRCSIHLSYRGTPLQFSDEEGPSRQSAQNSLVWVRSSKTRRGAASPDCSGAFLDSLGSARVGHYADQETDKARSQRTRILSARP